MTEPQKETIPILTVFKQNGKYGVVWSNTDTNKFEVLGFLETFTNKLKKEMNDNIRRKN